MMVLTCDPGHCAHRGGFREAVIPARYRVASASAQRQGSCSHVWLVQRHQVSQRGNHSDSRYPDAGASPQKPYLSAEGCNQSIPKREHARNRSRCLAELGCDRKPDGLRTAGHTSSHSPILERKEGWQLSLVRQLCPSRHGESETGTPGRYAEFSRYPWLCFLAPACCCSTKQAVRKRLPNFHPRGRRYAAPE